MLRWLFGKKAEKVEIDIHDLYKRFDLNNNRFEAKPDLHSAVLAHFGYNSIRSGPYYGPGRAFFADPDKKIIKKSPPKTFGDEPDYPDEHIQSSACIAFTEQERGIRNRGFAMIIRQNADTLDQLYNSVIFGIYGTYDHDGKMTVHKIIAPFKDDANVLAKGQSVPVTPENVEIALRFAELCAKALYNGKDFSPWNCYEQSLTPASKPTNPWEP